VFADFLIATEAELNKVSWTTRKRLYQDTIVVLVTVVLMAFYLFAMDQVWQHVLSWRPIGVIVMGEDDTQGAPKNTDQKPW
jgi:preprotein translocase SecE subunit